MVLMVHIEPFENKQEDERPACFCPNDRDRRSSCSTSDRQCTKERFQGSTSTNREYRCEVANKK